MLRSLRLEFIELVDNIILFKLIIYSEGNTAVLLVAHYMVNCISGAKITQRRRAGNNDFVIYCYINLCNYYYYYYYYY